MRLIDADAFKKVLAEKEMQHDKRRSFDEYSYGAASAYEWASELLDDMPTVERPHGECNQCRYYEGVHGVQGHAPCWHWNIGGVMWNDYCSRFEKKGETE